MRSTLIKINDALSHALSRQRACESCGGEFTCGAGLGGCWCSEISLSDETRTALKGLYRDCLCRACLEKLSAKEVANECS